MSHDDSNTKASEWDAKFDAVISALQALKHLGAPPSVTSPSVEPKSPEVSIEQQQPCGCGSQEKRQPEEGIRHEFKAPDNLYNLHKHVSALCESCPFPKIPQLFARVTAVEGLEVQDALQFEVVDSTVRDILEHRYPRFEVTLPDGRQAALIQVKLFTSSVRVTTSSGQEQEYGKQVEYDLGLHYHGIVVGPAEDTLSLTFFKNHEVVGTLRSAENGSFTFSKHPEPESIPESRQDRDLGVRKNHHLFYREPSPALVRSRSLGQKEEGGPDPEAARNWCATQDPVGTQFSPAELSAQPSSAALGATKCVRLYFETDYDVFQNKGSVQGVLNYLSAAWSECVKLYNNESIPFTISEIKVWDTPSPYTGSSSMDLLNQFATVRPTFNGDLGHLLAMRGGGGVAWVDVFCSHPSVRRAFSMIAPTFGVYPAYSWTVNVLVHEIGHNLGSPHTHACRWNGNNTAIDGCYTPEGGCPKPDPALPVGGGTIMSYCHLLPTGINFTKGFGPQPGNLIRARYAAAACLQPCDVVVVAPIITLTPNSLIFSGEAGGPNPAAKTFTITNTGGGSLAWTATGNPSWLIVTPTSGTAPSTVTVSINNLQMVAATYNATVTISAPGAAPGAAPKSLNVTLNLSPGPAGWLAPNPTSLSFTAQAGGSNPATQTFTIANINNTFTIPWVAADDAAWLTVAPTSGTTPGSATATVSITGLLPGSYSAIINLTSPGATTGTLPVNLTVTAPPPPPPAPVLVITLSSLSFSAQAGGSNPAPKSITLHAVAAGGATANIPWSAATNAAWLTVTPNAGPSTPASATATVNIGTLTPATYSAVITISSSSSGVIPVTLSVTLTISAPPPPPPFVLTVNPTSLSFSAQTGGSNPSSQLFTLSSGSVETRIPWRAAATSSWLTITPSSGLTPGSPAVGVSIGALAAGVYTDVITITSNPDVRPVTIPVTLTITTPPAPPVLVVTPMTLSFSAVAGGPTPAPQTFNITNGGGGVLHWFLNNPAWLSFNSNQGVAPATVTATVNISGLVPRLYSAQILVASFETAPKYLTVTLNLNAPPPPPPPTAPIITLSARALSFSGLASGPNPSPQPLTITNTGGGTLNFTAITTVAWLKISPGTGSLGAGISSNTIVSVQTTGLVPGTYTGTIFVSALGPTSQSVIVTLTVSAGPPPSPPIITLTPPALSFSATAGGSNPSQQSFLLFNTGPGTLDWTATEASSWLTISPTSGQGNANVIASVNTSSLVAGLYTAVVTVSAVGAVSKTLTVTLMLASPPSTPILTVNPPALTFSTPFGSTNPPSPQSVSVTNMGGGGVLTWMTSENASWLTLSPSSGSTPSSFTAAVSIANLVPGTYQANVSVSGSGGAATKVIPVTLTILPIAGCPLGSSLFQGTLSPQGEGLFYQASAAGTHSALLTGIPSTVNCDLQLYQYDVPTQTLVRRGSSTGPGNQEPIVFTSPAAGFFFFYIRSTAGSGSYTLCVSHP